MDNDELITKEELKKFKEIARKDDGVKLTDEQAYEQGSALVSFFEYIFKERLKE